jgi:hypothetical protein
MAEHAEVFISGTTRDLGSYRYFAPGNTNVFRGEPVRNDAYWVFISVNHSARTPETFHGFDSIQLSLLIT